MDYRIVGIGELLWDLLPAGKQMGGAPANFAYHARAFGADAHVISRVGDDPLGAEILRQLDQLGIPRDSIGIDPVHPTGTVAVELSTGGQPHYTICENVAWDHLTVEPRLLETVAEAGAVCFGSLAQRSLKSRSTIRELVRNAPPSALRVFDVNLRQNFYSRELLDDSLRIANVVKLNDSELPIVSELLGFKGSLREQMAALVDRFRLRVIACTRGEHGSILYDGQNWCEIRGEPVQVVDTIGAGDSYTAALTLGLLSGWGLEKSARLASDLAAYVCSCAGATPPLPGRFRGLFGGREPTARSL